MLEIYSGCRADHGRGTQLMKLLLQTQRLSQLSARPFVVQSTPHHSRVRVKQCGAVGGQQDVLIHSCLTQHHSQLGPSWEEVMVFQSLSFLKHFLLTRYPSCASFCSTRLLVEKRRSVCPSSLHRRPAMAGCSWARGCLAVFHGCHPQTRKYNEV